MSLYEWLSLVLETAVVIILLAEYFYGLPDIAIKREQAQKRRLRKKDFENLTIGESK